MKQTLMTILSVALCVVLLTGAVCLGAVRGWRSEREAAFATLSDGGSLTEDLAERAMDAANLAVVAARHLPAEDPALAALRDAQRVLQDASASVKEIIAADSALTAVAAELASALPALESVQNSARDQAYVATLTGILSAQTGAAELYRAQIVAFNDRMNASLTGKLAMFCGVEPLPQQ